MSKRGIRCGDDCILRRLSNGQHYVTTPSEAPTGSRVYECNFDSDLRYQILSHGTVVIHRKSQCPSCQGRSNSPLESLVSLTAEVRLYTVLPAQPTYSTAAGAVTLLTMAMAMSEQQAAPLVRTSCSGDFQRTKAVRRSSTTRGTLLEAMTCDDRA